MTKDQEKLRKLFKDLYTGQINTFEATVISRDDENLTVDIEPLEDAELFDVRLKAAIDQVKDGVVEYPASGSTVLVGVIRNNPETCFILKTSEVEKIEINGGDNGGLVIWPDTKAELEKNNEILQGLLDILTGTPINEPGNGAPSALQAALSVALAGKQVGDFDNKENEKVTH